LDSSIDSVQWSHWYPKVARNADVVVATAWMTAEFLGHDPRGLYFIQGYEVWDGPKDRVDATWRLPLRKLVIAQWLKDKAEELGAGPVTVVPNAIDSDIFNLDAPPEERSPDEIAMLWHYAPYKGSKDGLEALRMVRESRPNLHVTLFSGMAEPSGMPDWVTFVHNANQSQLRLIYNRAALFVSPSHTEGWGLPAAEAMACGAAVVSTDNEGVRDYAINGVTALVTPIRNPEALAGAILELLNDDGRRCAIARAGHEMMTTDFNWVSSTDLFEEALIDQVSAIGKGT
jgi:glycosyltransferase involved in cell wall biosynthesis